MSDDKIDEDKLSDEEWAKLQKEKGNLKENEDGSIEFKDPVKESEYSPGPFGSNVYYQVNENPDRYIGANRDLKIIEAERVIKYDRETGEPISERWVTTKTFTACKVEQITKHKNILDFLELPQLYTIKFKGKEPSGNFTLKQKTIQEIASDVRDTNGISETGIDIAIRMQLKAFEVAGLIKENDDMKYTGFFTNEEHTKIVSSGIELVEIDKQKVVEALDFIQELAENGYIGRLDLLAHTIKFGFIAPCSFVFKYIKAPWLEFLHFYGDPNSSKSSSGEIVLAFDGHHKDENFIVNMGHVDTPARLGETISQTTFPILVDELDYNDDKRLVNNVKTAVSNTTLRVVLDRFRRKTVIPALSALACTSNTEPSKEKGFRKRVFVRHFPTKETHFKGTADANSFEKLKANFEKLQILGDFRNKFVMENQDIILDKKLLSFEKALKIIIAVYEYVGKTVPEWLSKQQLEDTQLEESIGDIAGDIRHAFETYILENFRRALTTTWQRTMTETDLTLLPTDIGGRAIKVIDSGELVDIKRRESDGKIVIHRSILAELYRCGINSEQLINLRSFADSIGAKYSILHGRKVAIIDGGELLNYFLGDCQVDTQVHTQVTQVIETSSGDPGDPVPIT
jgi:hypothetical protein